MRLQGHVGEDAEFKKAVFRVERLLQYPPQLVDQMQGIWKQVSCHESCWL